MANRLSKEQLENDQLVTSYYLTVTWIKQNQGIVFGGIIAVIALIGGIIWYVTNAAANETKARTAITYAENEFMRGNFENALYGNEENMRPGLVEITSRFPRTTAGNLAFYYAAVSEINLGNYETALEYISNYKPARGVMGVSPISLHGVVLMQLERYSDAIRVFERAANWDVNDSTTPFNLMLAAEAAHAAGNNRKASELVSKIKSEYPESPQMTQAQRLAGKLSVS
jgi:TolA-binding protein